jgi:hypothetical protein
LEVLFEEKERIENHIYVWITGLLNLDLRLCCYDLTSAFFESEVVPSSRFPSRAFGFSRDHRGDRPQVMVGLLITSDGLPIAHYVFDGNTKTSTTLPEVMIDLQARFGVGRIALIADRGLISEQNLLAVTDAGFDHVLATRLHRDADAEAVLVAARDPAATWVQIEEARSSACEVVHGGRRYVIVDSLARHRRDDHRGEELLGRTESKLIALEARVREGRLVDSAKIGVVAVRILRDSGVARCSSNTIRQGCFTGSFDAEALSFEEVAFAGRYVITTSLTPAEGLDRAGRPLPPKPRERRAALQGDEGLPRAPPCPPLHRGTRPWPHRALRHRRGDRGAHLR